MILSFSDRYRYFVYAGSCDMRNGYDCLSGLVRNEFKKNPLVGDVFVFFSKHRNKMKLLHWQSDGFCIYIKRLEKGTFEIPKATAISNAIEITPHQLQFILDGIVLYPLKKECVMSIILLIKSQ
jgi:transposase